MKDPVVELFVNIETEYRVLFQDKRDVDALMAIVEIAYPMLHAAVRSSEPIEYTTKRAYALALLLKDRIHT